MYVLIGLSLRCVRYVTLETALHVSLCLMSYACTPVCPPCPPLTKSGWPRALWIRRLWLPYQRLSGYHKTFVSFEIPIHVTNKDRSSSCWWMEYDRQIEANSQRNFHLSACQAVLCPKKLDRSSPKFYTIYSGINGDIKSCIHKVLSHSVSECQSVESAGFAIYSQNCLP